MKGEAVRKGILAVFVCKHSCGFCPSPSSVIHWDPLIPPSSSQTGWMTPPTHCELCTYKTGPEATFPRQYPMLPPNTPTATHWIKTREGVLFCRIFLSTLFIIQDQQGTRSRVGLCLNRMFKRAVTVPEITIFTRSNDK